MKKREKKTADNAEILQLLTAVMRGKTEDHIVVNRRVRLEEAGENGGKRISESLEPLAVCVPVKLSDRMKAAELLGKSRGLFKEKGAAGEKALLLVVDDIPG